MKIKNSVLKRTYQKSEDTKYVETITRHLYLENINMIVHGRGELQAKYSKLLWVNIRESSE